MSTVVDLLSNFTNYFWEVFAFWACWQVCDYALSKAKVKLRKPWRIEVDNPLDNSYNEGSRGKSVGSPDRDKERGAELFKEEQS